MRRMYSQKQLEKIVDNVVEEKDIAPVSGTSDGTNWTSLTVGDETHGFAASGGEGNPPYVWTGSEGTITEAEFNEVKEAFTQGKDIQLSATGVILHPFRHSANAYGEYIEYCYSSTSGDDSPSFHPVQNYSYFFMKNASNQTYSLSVHYYYPVLDVKVGGTSVVSNTSIAEIPAVSGTNDGTNWSTITIGNNTYNIPTAPANYVTTDTAQTITAKKTFKGESSSSTSGIHFVNRNDVEYGRLNLNGSVFEITNPAQAVEITSYGGAAASIRLAASYGEHSDITFKFKVGPDFDTSFVEVKASDIYKLVEYAKAQGWIS